MRQRHESTPSFASTGTVEAEVSEPPAERLIAGTPQLQVRNFFSDTTQQFFAGRWSATRGKWRVRYTENELCVMTAGPRHHRERERRAQQLRSPAMRS